MPPGSTAAGMISSGGRDAHWPADTCDTLDSMDWSDLTDELDAWRAEGRIASLWWRDDDAVAPAPALDRLAGLAGEHGVTVGLAVIPALVQPSLAPWLEGGVGPRCCSTDGRTAAMPREARRSRSSGTIVPPE